MGKYRNAYLCIVLIGVSLGTTNAYSCGSSQYEMDMCAQKHFENSDEKLNSIYRKIYSKQSAINKSLLSSNQKKGLNIETKLVMKNILTIH